VVVLIPALSVVLLVIGLIVRSMARTTAPRERPFWKARHAFTSGRAYAIYAAGTISIVVGASLLVLSSLLRVL
jgi:hypothetical protein